MSVDCREFEKLLSEGISELPVRSPHTSASVPPVPRNGRLGRKLLKQPQRCARHGKALNSGRASGNPWKLKRESSARRWWHGGSFRQLSLQWQAATAALILVLSGLGGWMMLRPSQPTSVEAERRLLTEQALDEIERSEGGIFEVD